MKKLLLFVVMLIVVAGCSNDEEPIVLPHDEMADYIALWEENAFDQMYQTDLTEATKETFAKADYVDRYRNLYNDLEVKSLSVDMTDSDDNIASLKESIDETDRYTMPLQISFDTLAGTIEYETDVIMEKVTTNKNGEPLEQEKWLIQWKPSLILPNLEQGEKVAIERTSGRRGDILDRNGNALATIGEVYEIGITPNQFEEATLDQLSANLRVSSSYIQNKLNQSWVEPNFFVPITQISIDQQDTVATITQLEGVTTRVKMDRVYPYGKAAAHLTGYIGPITASELEEHQDKGYDSSDVIGKRGLEQLFEDQLRAKDGVAIVIEKHNGSTQSVVEQKAQDGQTIETTIDMNLQETLYGIVENEAGTATIMDPKTGEVLSLLSFPAFDPNRFVMGMTSSQYDELVTREGQPTLNRFAATYAPGSTMKVLTSLVGFQQGELNPEEVETIEGLRWQQDSSWGDYYVTRVNGNVTNVDYETAMTYSDNIYFARLGLDIGRDAFVTGLNQLGFGESLPFTYPLPESQVSNSGSISSEGQLADTAFGQGELLMTNTHLATIYAGVANDGQYMEPTLLLNDEQSVWKNDIVTDKQNQTIQDALRQVVVNGSASDINIDNKTMAGKTGTVELKADQEVENGKQNGLFVSYDQSKRDMVLSLLIEGVQDRGGSGLAVQLSKQFFESYE
ncbi:penicillin-binding protein [Alkalibacillus flavidus]|uniref:serine-type D-Ala-D-Ala carboxypeptidase n=1 Tax=Alkalibacillus flavidus TaxID=546021 RepID=A0ABV2KRR1_9BACI